MNYRSLWTILAVGISLLPLDPALAQDLRIGVVPGAYGDSVAKAAEIARAENIEVEVIEFTDWTTPNVALQSGDIDVNYFQHKPFLDNAIKERGYDFAIAGVGALSNIGLYSLRHKSFDEIPDGGTVAIPNDPVNQGRGLLLLERAGLIELKEGVGFLGTLDDIVANPRNLTFNEVEGPQLVRVTPDVDLSVGYPHFIVASGTFDPSAGLIYSGIEDRQFAIRFVTRSQDAERADIKRFIEIYQSSPEVAEVIDTAFAKDPQLYVLAWKN
ncbi:MetQ/NlpA family ABC transporter substrate-binding protein [Aureimonas altamirensis]|uniref:MetQ/NlpA family ABC transporter substrate-binding protein n=1 Tax=Aureimonas altamirensis TaxID=370622 RepID=UPI002036ACE9|nr:MetQ/NlpA family ABC transporter substrate-binding protein [Aureimonas altamirensis]MCM2503823.1 MetQ/NlpA family ABC transporter substrate-binding protein [Aureimonas altamirensis]